MRSLALCDLVSHTSFVLAALTLRCGRCMDGAHTANLPDRNRSTDAWVAQFGDSALDTVVAALESADFVELGPQRH